MKQLVFVLVFSLLAVSAQATTLEIALNDDSAQLQLGFPINTDDYGMSVMGIRFLYNDKEEAALGSFGFDFWGSPGNVPGLDLGIGTSLYVGQADRPAPSDDADDLLVLGLGARVSYIPPSLKGLGFAGKVLYGPNILAFIDAERLVEAGVQISYAVTPKVALLVEYQDLSADLDGNDDRKLDQSVRLGFQARF